jgi:hypothetical protein
MRRLAILLAIAAAVGPGCNGDDEPGPRADFLRRADRICLQSGIRPKAVPNDLPAAAGQLAEEARLRAGVHEKLSALEPPAELRDDFARFLDQTGRVARDLERMAGLARAGREADLGDLSRRTGELEAQRFELAEEIGFRRCGQPITEPVRD